MGTNRSTSTTQINAPYRAEAYRRFSAWNSGIIIPASTPPIRLATPTRPMLLKKAAGACSKKEEKSSVPKKDVPISRINGVSVPEGNAKLMGGAPNGFHTGRSTLNPPIVWPDTQKPMQFSLIAIRVYFPAPPK